MAMTMATTAAAAMMDTTVNATTVKYDADFYGTCSVTAYDPSVGTVGAWGTTLTPGKSCAASRSIPFGTQLYVEGYGIVTVEDRTADWYEEDYGGMVVDLYLEDYNTACDWGRQECKVYILSDPEVLKK